MILSLGVVVGEIIGLVASWTDASVIKIGMIFFQMRINHSWKREDQIIDLFWLISTRCIRAGKEDSGLTKLCLDYQISEIKL